MQTPFEAFKEDVKEIFMEKLAKSPAQTFWRMNSPSHFGGHTGTFTAIQEMLVCPAMITFLTSNRMSINREAGEEYASLECGHSIPSY